MNFNVSHLSKKTGIAIGILTFLPPFYMLASFIGFAFVITLSGPKPDPRWFIAFMAAHLLVMLLMLGLLIFYVAHIVTNVQLTSDHKILWIVLLFFAGIIAMPIYWFLFILRDGNPALGRAEPPSKSYSGPL